MEQSLRGIDISIFLSSSLVPSYPFGLVPCLRLFHLDVDGMASKRTGYFSDDVADEFCAL
jgi:hypothetical protein